MKSSREKTIVWMWMFMMALSAVSGQSPTKLSHKSVLIHSDTVVLDTHSLLLGSVFLHDVNKEDYTIDHLNGWIVIHNPSLKGETIRATFRSYPYKINAPTLNKPLSVIEKRLYEPINPFSVTEPSSPLSDMFSEASLNTYGSLSRGISIGNAQDMTVNSNLNLQISGKLDENIEILANITDHNIPIQAEGNSAKLKDFDRIFISLRYKNMVNITAGDILPKSSQGYFLNYTKQGMGLQADALLTTKDKKEKSTQYNVYASGSVAKGSFRKQHIAPIEGVQGAYKLYGNNNEMYFAVLSGSERVYINGVLLKRGENADYTIDYNRSEITFTTRQPITKDKRIVIEFEYSDQSYTRALFTAGTEVKRKKISTAFHFYHEQDLKNQPNQLELADNQRNFLASIGNNTHNSYMVSLDSSAFRSEEIRYKMVDTVVNGVVYDSILVYSSSPDSAFYRLQFTCMGSGKGDYLLAQHIANGRVFVWVEPIGGVKQGDYAPVRFIPAPQKKQLYTLGATYSPWENTALSVETALSNNDLNTFSKLDDQHNVGFALKTTLNNTIHLGKKGRWQMNSGAYYEFKNANFRHVEDYRDIEFARNYNLSDSLKEATEHQIGLRLSFLKADQGEMTIAGNAYLIPSAGYLSAQSNLLSRWQTRGYTALADVRLLNNKQSTYKTLFLQNKELLSKTFSRLEVGVSDEFEMNLYRTLDDSLMRQSFAANEATIFIKSNDSLSQKVKYGLSYTNRLDGYAHQNSLRIHSLAHQIAANAEIVRLKNHQLRFDAAYRRLSYADSVAANTLLASADYQANFLKSALRVGLFYQIGSGLEQKNEYTYLRVTDGKGVYQWIDYNGNGIEELDEFETALYADQARYIRVWTPSGQYVRTLDNHLSANLHLDPAALWRNARGFKKFMSRFANQTSYQTQLKNTSGGFAAMLNPFHLRVSDTALVLAASSLRNTFWFNRNSSLVSAHAIYNQTVNKTVNTNGFETTEHRLWILSGKCNIKKLITLQADYQNAEKSRRYQYLQDRDYRIEIHDLQGSLSFDYKNALKLTTLYQYLHKDNHAGVERSRSHIAGLEVNYNIVRRGSLFFKTSYHYILFTGEVNTSVAYEMLDALNPGHNIIFNLAFHTTLFQNLQFNLSYEGRLAQQSIMKHLATVEIRAYF